MVTQKSSLVTAKTVEVQPITITQLLSQSVLRFGDHPALVFMGFPITYNALADLVNRMAQSLTNLGIGPGDRVAIMLPNLPQTVVVNYAILRLGAVAVMVNPLYTVPELTYQLNDSGAETLIVLDMLIDKAKAVLPQTPLKQLVVCHANDLIPISVEALPAGTYRPVETGEGVYNYRDLQENYSIGHPFADQSRWDSLAALLYTGGTTGVSKGVMLTHANISSRVQHSRAKLGEAIQDGQERMPAIFPMFHTAGYIDSILFSLSYGTTIVLVPRPEPDGIIGVLKTV